MINLTKGQPICLTKIDESLKVVKIGLGWEHLPENPVDFDISTFLTDGNKRTLSDAHVVFYGTVGGKSPCGSVNYSGDNKTGSGQVGEDKETVLVNLTTLPPEVQRVVFVASIHNYEKLGQNIGSAKNAFLRVLNNDTGVVIARGQLEENKESTAIIMGEAYRVGNDWEFDIINQGYSDGLAGAAAALGQETTTTNP